LITVVAAAVDKSSSTGSLVKKFFPTKQTWVFLLLPAAGSRRVVFFVQALLAAVPTSLVSYGTGFQVFHCADYELGAHIMYG
jgi:hypothetical protein